MAKFKKGDNVVRIDRFRDSTWRQAVGDPAAVCEVVNADSYSMRFAGVRDWWDTDKFELYVEPQPEPVAVTEPAVQQIPGVPDGYRLVRIGAPKKGEQFIGGYDILSKADVNMYDYTWVIVEPIVPPAPPTPVPTKVKVQLNRYLVGDLQVPATLFVLEATEEYIENNYGMYRLLGPSETLELEVEV